VAQGRRRKKTTISLTKTLHRTAKGEKEPREEKPGNCY
jgi:hypothetical protein